MNLEMLLRMPAAWWPPIMFADGMGVDSAAMIELCKQLKIVPDAHLHADTGDEHPETVLFREVRRQQLVTLGWPELTIVRRRPSKTGTRARRDGTDGVSYDTLGGNCIANATMPGLAFGRKSCSEKWKVEPQNDWTKRWDRAKRAWARGQRIVKLIGYDAGPADMRRAHNLKSDHRYQYVYPLRDAGWDRERCIKEILAAGSALPRKSACIYCPAAKTWEIAQLVAHYPAKADYIILVEDTAQPNNRGVQGLWRNGTKGTRGGVAKPGSMAQFIRELRADPAELRRHLAMAPEHSCGSGCG